MTSHGALNARAEYRQNKIERVAVSLTSREQRAADKETEKEEAEVLSAVQVLSDKLEVNKHVKTVPSNPNFSDHLEEVSLVKFTDTNNKRELDLDKDKSIVTCKRFKSCTMGRSRSSKGKTHNESNNLWKFMSDWSNKTKSKKESLCTVSSPASFAEASLLAES